MSARRPEGSRYLPGRLYDLAFRRMFRGLRRRVARTVRQERLYPWLDVCCGTGDQLRRWAEEGADPEPQEIVVGLDLGYGFVRYARARAPEIPFVCGDASRLPFRSGSFRAVSVSFGLHDKSLELRTAILAEARRALRPDGRFIAVDFEPPWDGPSRLGAQLTRIVERFARGEHYRNGRDFLRRGGLRAFLGDNGFVEVSRHDGPVGSLGVVVARVSDPAGCCSPTLSESDRKPRR